MKKNALLILMWGLLLAGATPTLVSAHRGGDHPAAEVPVAPLGGGSIDAYGPDSRVVDPSEIVEPAGGWFYVWFDMQLFSLLFTVWAVYMAGIGPLRPKIDPTLDFPRNKALLFTAGIVVYYLSVSSSLDEIGEVYLFTGHMLQHNVIIYIVPLLILLGLPIWLIDAVLDNRVLRALARYFGHPMVAFVLFNLCFVIWHVPEMYEWALRDKMVHDIEHFSFLSLAIFMWWPIYGPSTKHAPPLRHYGLQMLYIFALAVAQLPLFAYLCFAEAPHYPTYAAAPRITDMSPLDDQFVGGILMKVFAMIAFILVWAQIFFRWARESNATSGNFEPVATPVQGTT